MLFLGRTQNMKEVCFPGLESILLKVDLKCYVRPKLVEPQLSRFPPTHGEHFGQAELCRILTFYSCFQTATICIACRSLQIQHVWPHKNASGPPLAGMSETKGCLSLGASSNYTHILQQLIETEIVSLTSSIEFFYYFTYLKEQQKQESDLDSGPVAWQLHALGIGLL